MAKRTEPRYGITKVKTENGQNVKLVNDYKQRPIMDLIFQPSTYYYLHKRWKNLKANGYPKNKWHYGSNFDIAIKEFRLVEAELRNKDNTYMRIPYDSIREIGEVGEITENKSNEHFSSELALSFAIPSINETLKIDKNALLDIEFVGFLEGAREHFLTACKNGDIKPDDYAPLYQYYKEQGAIIDGFQMNESVLYSLVRNLLINDTDMIADKTGLPCLKTFHEQLRQYKEPLPLLYTEVLETYIAQATCDAGTKNRAVRYFERFVEIVGKKDMSKIDKNDVAKFKNYLDSLVNSRSGKKASNVSLNAFSKDVKTVLNAYVNEEDSSKVEAARNLAELIKDGIERKQTKPNKVQKWDAHALYELFNLPQIKNDKVLKLMFLLTLNCGWNSVDVANFSRSDDKESKHIYRIKEPNPNFSYGLEENETNNRYLKEHIMIDFPRIKMKCVYDRQCILWEKTADLLDEYLKETAELKSDFVFVNPKTKTKYSDQYLSCKFGDFFDKKKLNMPKIKLANDRNALFKHLRSTLSTIAHENRVQYLVIDLFLGHSLRKAGEIGSYVGNLEKALHEIADGGYNDLKNVIDTL